MTRIPTVKRPGASVETAAGADARGRRGARWRWAVELTLGLTLGLVLGLTGCSLDGLVNNDKLPPEVTDPAITQTPTGALAAYHGTIAQFRFAFGGRGGGVAGSVIEASGLLSDELEDIGAAFLVPEDQRALPETNVRYQSAETYSRLQRVRGQAGQAIALLTRYRPADSALAGHLYALQGYAELFLAELFCSGIPLSTIDFDGDYTFRPGASTADVLAHARALFDTALVLGADSARVVHLAHVGQARTLLAAGQPAEAAAVAALVPEGYRDTLTFIATATGPDLLTNAPNFFAGIVSGWTYSVADREGGNGLDYVASADPRIPVTLFNTVPNFGAQWYPSRYATDGTSPLVLASALEARLIEAEGALRQTPTDPSGWLALLNALRTDGTEETVSAEDPNDPDATVTRWRAGTGGVAGLAPLDDPGTDSARVSLVFRERAFWLFLTGHRQGDLRRLLRDPWYRQWWPTQDRVYPVGAYVRHSAVSQYGEDVTLPIPPAERVLNPHFHGCLSRGA